MTNPGFQTVNQFVQQNTPGGASFWDRERGSGAPDQMFSSCPSWHLEQARFCGNYGGHLGINIMEGLRRGCAEENGRGESGRPEA
eukprot:941310-Pelagomonas_calceolata.AAC.1